MFGRRIFQWTMVWLVCLLILVGTVICTNFSIFIEVLKQPLLALVNAALPLIIYVALFIAGGRFFLRCMGFK